MAYLIEAGVAAAAALKGVDLRVDATREELERIEAEGRQAWERFLLSNLRLVWSVTGPAARRSGLQEEDLFQEGVWALVRALRTFNPKAGRFITHAFQRVRGHVTAVTAGRVGAMGLTASQAVTLRRARAIEARLEAESGRPASIDDVARELGRSSAGTARLLAHQAPVLIGDIAHGRAQTTAPEPAEANEFADFAHHLQRLPGKQQRVLALRYGFADGRARSYREISKDMAISASDAQRTCQAALDALRQSHARDIESERATAVPRPSAKALAVLAEIDRLTAKGLSLLEVAIAMKTEPLVVYDACRGGDRKDLLARLVRMELRMVGPQPAGTDVLAGTIRRFAAIRRQDDEQPGVRQAAKGARQLVELPRFDPRSLPSLTSPGL